MPMTWKEKHQKESEKMWAYIEETQRLENAMYEDSATPSKQEISKVKARRRRHRTMQAKVHALAAYAISDPNGTAKRL